MYVCPICISASAFDRWDLLSLRLHLCAVVRRYAQLVLPSCHLPVPCYDNDPPIADDGDDDMPLSLRSPCGEASSARAPCLLTPFLRKTFFEFLMAWCGHGPSSAAYAAKVQKHKQEMLKKVKDRDFALSVEHALQEQVSHSATQPAADR